MNIRTLEIALVLAGLALGIFAVAYFGGALLLPATSNSGSEVEDIQGGVLGAHAPYFDLPDINGTHVRLSDFPAAPLIVMFWSTWSAEAQNQLEILDSFASAEEARGIVKVIAIDSQEERSLAHSYIERGGYRVQALVDSLGGTTESYGVKSLPTTYFIDADGIVRSVVRGLMSKKNLVDKLETIVRQGS